MSECGQIFPHVFPSCAVTRARGKQLKADRLCEGEVSLRPDSEVTIEKTLPGHSENYVDESGLLPSNEVDGGTVEDEPLGMTLTDNITWDSSDYFSGESVSREKGKLENLLSSIFNVSQENLIQEQLADVTLKPLFSMVCIEGDIETTFLLLSKRGVVA